LFDSYITAGPSARISPSFPAIGRRAGSPAAQRGTLFTKLANRALHRERPGGLTASLWLNYHSLQLERFFDFVEHCSGGTASTDLQTTVFQIATRLFQYSGTARRLAARSFKGAIR
jgi:hypothetical protein